MKHTYELVEAIISKKARLQNKKKNGEIKKSFVLDCFSPECAPYSLLSRLDASLHKVSLQLISKLII